MRMILKRVSYSDHGTFGVLLYENIPFAVTLERPWRDNRRSESCIPTGEYSCLRCRRSPDYGYADSPRFGDTFQVYNVPGRSKILFHKGNLDDDSHGCILIGEQFGRLNDEPGILRSGDGYGEFMDLLNGADDFVLTITQDTGSTDTA